MKKTGICLSALLLVCASFFGVSNPSLDGRAVVADADAFPINGIYGKAVGYLPGDIVIVTNHATGFSIEVMILSSADASEGIAIVLSPEAAEKLQIARGKDAYVKIQKKQPVVYEKAVSTGNKNKPVPITDDPDKNSAKLIEQTPSVGEKVSALSAAELKNDADTAVPEIVPSAENTPADTVASSDETEETAPAAGIPPLSEETEEIAAAENEAPVESELPALEEVAAAEPAPEDALPADTAYTDELPASDEVAAADITDEVPADAMPPESAIALESEPAAEETPVLPAETLLPGLEAVAEAAEPADPEASIAVLPETSTDEVPVVAVPDAVPPVADAGESARAAEEIPAVPAEDMIAILEPASANPPPLDEAGLAYEKIIAGLAAPAVTEAPAEKIPEQEVVSALPEVLKIEETPEAPAVQELPPAEIADSTVGAPELFPETESPAVPAEIIAVTPEPVFPLADTLLPEETASRTVSDEPAVTVAVPEIPEEAQPETAVALTRDNAAFADKYAKITCGSVSDLSRGSYYVQIATMREESNIDSLVQKYGTKYPLNLLKLDGSRGYQVLVGPLGDDEHELILARFRSRGFKDAFVRNIK